MGRALFDPPPVHEGGAVDQDLVDLGAAGTELAAVLHLEREDPPGPAVIARMPSSSSA